MQILNATWRNWYSEYATGWTVRDSYSVIGMRFNPSQNQSRTSLETTHLHMQSELGCFPP